MTSSSFRYFPCVDIWAPHSFMLMVLKLWRHEETQFLERHQDGRRSEPQNMNWTKFWICPFCCCSVWHEHVLGFGLQVPSCFKPCCLKTLKSWSVDQVLSYSTAITFPLTCLTLLFWFLFGGRLHTTRLRSYAKARWRLSVGAGLVLQQ